MSPSRDIQGRLEKALVRILAEHHADPGPRRLGHGGREGAASDVLLDWLGRGGGNPDPPRGRPGLFAVPRCGHAGRVSPSRARTPLDCRRPSHGAIRWPSGGVSLSRRFRGLPKGDRAPPFGEVVPMLTRDGGACRYEKTTTAMSSNSSHAQADHGVCTVDASRRGWFCSARADRQLRRDAGPTRGLANPAARSLVPADTRAANSNRRRKNLHRGSNFSDAKDCILRVT